MTSSRDPNFLQALETELNRREVIESPFAPPLMPSATPMPPGSFPTPHADIALHPRLGEQMLRDREAQLKRLTRANAASNFEFKYDVFIVHRSPGACFECKLLTKEVFTRREQALTEGGDPSEIEPDFDFQNCPHNRRAEYVALMNRALRKEITVCSHREETLQSGAVQVCISWGEPLRPVRPGQNTPPGEPRTT